MPEAKSTESDKVEVESPVAEEPSKGLSTRDALEVAILANKDEPKSLPETDKETVSKASEAAPVKQEKEKPLSPAFQPPAEWNKEEKEDFLASSRGSQEAALRLHRSRQKTLEDIKAAKAEHADLTSLRDSMAPYLKAIGVKEPTEVALKKALTMWREFEEGDPVTAAKAYLKAKGKEKLIPKDWDAAGVATPDPEKVALQNRLSAVESRLVEEDQTKTRTAMQTVFDGFSTTKNAGGTERYPDLNKPGSKLAAQIGSLVNVNDPVSQRFIASVKERIPDLTWPVLLHEAYRFLGGQVDDSEAPKTQTTQDSKLHLVKSRQAASSRPGNGSGSTISGPPKKMSRREALAAAIAEHNQE